MSSVTVPLPNGAEVLSALNKVTLTGSNNNVPMTMPIVNPQTTLGELAPNWQQVAAPGQIAPDFTIQGPRPLHTITLQLTIVNTANQDTPIDGLLSQLYSLLQSQKITLTYGSFESSRLMTASGFWVCTSYQPQIVMRDPETNSAIQATANITLTEGNPPPVVTGTSLAS